MNLPAKKNYSIEILSGLTVAIALVPEAIAFAFIAGVGPLVGLYAAFLVGLITACFGGRPGMISGATGALAVVMISLVQQHGVEYLFATVVLMGVLQVIFGALRFGKFIKMVPYPVMLGFVNGLAIVIFLAQFNQFQIPDATGTLVWLQGSMLWIMLGLVLLTMLIIRLFPMITRKIPAPLVAIISISSLVLFFNIPAITVGDIASIKGSLPEFHWPSVPLNLETLAIIFPYSIILATIGLIESLLTVTLIDEMTQTRGQNSRECVAQGAANIVSGFFASMGGCAMIGQSMVNMRSGGRTRLSGIVAALSLLCFILFASGLIEMIPVAALVGIMFIVVIETFAWSSFRILNKIPRADALILILVSIVTVFTDLAVAVIVGVIVSALVFSWNSARSIHLETDNQRSNKNKRCYILHGHVFFASTIDFKNLFQPETDPKDVFIDFKYSRVWDHSGLQAIDDLAEKYTKLGKRLHLLHLSPDCTTLLDKGSQMVESELDPDQDPHYRVIIDSKSMTKHH
jgi:sulfate permease, SulP family